MKKFAAILLALVMALSLCSVSWAENEGVTTADGLAAAVATGGDIKLANDIVLSNALKIEKKCKIDLNGKTLSRTGSYVLDIYAEATITNGTVKMISGVSSINTNTCAIWLNSNAKVVIENTAKICTENDEKSNFAIGFDPSCSGAELIFNGEIKAPNGITVNGEIEPENTLIVNGTIVATNGQGLYLAGKATTTVNEGASITGNTGIEIRAGKLNVVGGDIESTGTYNVEPNAGGATTNGAAIAVAEHTTKQGVTVNVTGGTITAANTGKVLAVNDPQNNGGENVTLAVSGGTMTGDVAVGDSIKEKKPLTVSGGTFKDANGGKVDVSEYLENGKQQNADGSVGNKSSGGYYYAGPSISAVLNGANKSATDYTSGDYGLIFRSTASYSGFQGVQVDGKALAKGNYTAEANGSGTEVYLKAAYLKTLAAGKHTVTILSTAGNVSMDFTIGGKTTAPQTFDAGIALYVGMALTSAAGVAFVGKKRED